MSGKLPKGWIISALSNFCVLIRGVSYKKKDVRYEETDNYIPLLRANNIKGNITFLNLQYVPKIIVNEKQFLKKGDIVIAMSSGSKKVVGKTAPILEDWHGTFGAFCGVLRSVLVLNNGILPYFLKTQYYRNIISNLATGTNINNIKTPHFDEIYIPLPPSTNKNALLPNWTKSSLSLMPSKSDWKTCRPSSNAFVNRCSLRRLLEN